MTGGLDWPQWLRTLIEKDITRLSMGEIMAMKGWTRPDAPEGPDLGPDFWKRARVVMPEEMKERLDAVGGRGPRRIKQKNGESE